MSTHRGIPDNGMIGLIRTPLTDAAFEKLKQAQLEAASQAGRHRLLELRAHPEEVARLLERTRWTMYTDKVKRV